MENAVKVEREADLTEKMGNLRVGQEDLQAMGDVQLEVSERLIQIVGHFFKYDTTCNKNILIKEGLFLCVDKVRTAEGREQYLIHVVDAAQSHSYCRTPILYEALI